MSKFLELKSRIKAFEKAQSTYSSAGAADTEPYGVFQQLLVRAFKGKNPPVPNTPNGWELYSDLSNSPAASKQLTKCALACTAIIGEITLDEAAEVEVFLRDYCWRIDW